ncbi:MAG TPA: hypothetical protein VMG10_02505 [Gemmataceae bacterium]|nr:hypothetical protein [Gemmataceae bacterium]
MRTLVSTLPLLIFLSLSAAADDPPAETKDEAGLTVGKNLPGSFHPYNVTGPHQERFHCLISEHGLDPMVMIFYKNVDFGEPLPNLLKRLDTAIEQNPNTRLGAFVVCLPDGLPDVVGSTEKDQDANTKNDDARLDLAKKIEAVSSDNKLKHVVLCLDHKSDVAKYQLGDDKLITVVLYAKLKVVAVHALPKSEFTEAAVEKIMADVAEKLGAKRK